MMMVVSLLCSATAAAFLEPHLDHRGLMPRRIGDSTKVISEKRNLGKKENEEKSECPNFNLKILSLATIIDYIDGINIPNQEKINEINAKIRAIEIENENENAGASSVSLKSVYTDSKIIYQIEKKKIEEEIKHLEKIKKQINGATPQKGQKKINDKHEETLETSLEEAQSLLKKDEKKNAMTELKLRINEVFMDKQMGLMLETGRDAPRITKLWTTVKPSDEQKRIWTDIDNEQLPQKAFLLEFSGLVLKIIKDGIIKRQQKKSDDLFKEMSQKPEKTKRKNKESENKNVQAAKAKETDSLQHEKNDPSPIKKKDEGKPAKAKAERPNLSEEDNGPKIYYYIIELRFDGSENWFIHGLWPVINSMGHKLEEVECQPPIKLDDAEVEGQISETYSPVGSLAPWDLFEHEYWTHGVWMPEGLSDPKEYAKKSIELFHGTAKYECENRRKLSKNYSFNRRCKVCFDVAFKRIHCPY